MNRSKCLVFFTVVLLLLQLQKVKGWESSDHPNVLFILVDDLNDYESFMGSHPQVKTPNITQLAESGVAFMHAYSNAPVCAPSRSSLMTGVYPHNSEKYGFSRWYENPVLKNCKTLPEHFDENGYHVAGTGKLFHHNRKSLWNEWGHDKNQGPFAFDGEKLVGHPSVPEPFRSVGLLDGSFGPLSDVPTFPVDSTYWSKEAENARLVGSTTIDSDCDNASGGEFVKLKGDAGNAVVFEDVQVDSAGTYKLGIHYFYDRERVLEVFVNQASQGVQTLPAAHWCFKDAPERYAMNVDLEAGTNSIKLQVANGKTGPFIDKISLFVHLGEKTTGWVYNWNKEPFRYKSLTDRDLMPDEKHAQWAVDKIKEFEDQPGKRPFFLGVGFQRPHTPMYAPRKYFDMFPLDSLKLPKIKENDNEDTWYLSAFSDSKKGPKHYRALKKSYPDFETGLKKFVQAYLACIAFVDAQIGKVLNALENSDLNDNTIVVLTSDHGWNLGEKEYLFKNSPWEESTRVPLLVRAPGVSKTDARVDHPVSLIDIYPTLRDLCGLTGSTLQNEQGAPLDGHSLKPFLIDPGYEGWKGPDGGLSVIYGGITSDDIYEQTYAYRTENWRYILYHNGKEELYNHTEDPYEWWNLSGDSRYDEEREELKDEMVSILEGTYVTAVPSVSNYSSGLNGMVYPNPASSVLHVRVQSAWKGKFRVGITDLTGRSIYSGWIKTDTARDSFRINMGGSLSSGTYVLRILSQSGQEVFSEMITINRQR